MVSAAVRERVGLVVVAGPESEPLIIVYGAVYVSDAERGFKPDNGHLLAVRRDVPRTLPVEPVEAGVTHHDVGMAGQRDRATPGFPATGTRHAVMTSPGDVGNNSRTCHTDGRSRPGRRCSRTRRIPVP